MARRDIPGCSHLVPGTVFAIPPYPHLTTPQAFPRADSFFVL